MNDLAAAKVNDFQKLISSFGGLVRVELADVSSVPFLVNLYHPTVEGRNLGLSFYCPNEQAGENARRRRWEEKLARMEGNFASDENSDEGSSDELSSLPDFWPELHIVPEAWLMPAIACAYADTHLGCGPCRVIIAKVNDQTVLIRSADHGWKKSLLKTSCLSGCLRLLTREFAEIPLMYLCRLPSSWDNRPHRSETNILRSILPVGTPVKIRCCRGKRTVPVKADFFLETGESVLDIVQEL
ncbi:unnamed protein product [Gongylonema pulchrum]|uniref:Tudor domain-containing protein n=1 Tax=Gongylonema pulchrum TaxID=637853 RepID=A0A183EJB4_9BILA|nr:unnamed protein product [Gongylonema pulchrum]